MFDTVPATLNPNVTSWLTYDDSAEFPVAEMLEEFNPFDDFALVPTDGMETLPSAGKTVTLELTMDNLGDGAN